MTFYKHEEHQIKEKLMPDIIKEGISEKCLDESLIQEWFAIELGLIYGDYNNLTAEGVNSQRIINRARALQSLYTTASQLGINQKYIKRQVGVVGTNESEFYDVGKMKKGDLKKIINKALKMQKKEKGLTSKLTLIGIGISLLTAGLFLLFSNITGNLISNIGKMDSNILGVILFIGGLITLFSYQREIHKTSGVVISPS